MENASKALLIAGGMLIALLIIGALLIMITHIGDYQSSGDRNKKNSQLAKFNRDFERFVDDKGITGVDIISLINKVIDYNNKSANSESTNYVDYNIKITLQIRGFDSFNGKYVYNSKKIFDKDIYKFGPNQTAKEGNSIKTLQDLAKAETILKIPELKQLSNLYSNDDTDTIEKIKEKLQEIDNDKYKNWNGKNKNEEPTLDTIIKYTQYSEFKTSKFIVDDDPVYENGQIKELFFVFKE